MNQPSALLEVAGVSLRFGDLVALDDVSFTLQRGQFSALIGPNGAGKTSLFNCVSRFYTPDIGAIQLDGVDLLAVAPHRIGGLGVARTFQEPALVGSMSVLENVLLGTHLDTASGLFRGAFRTPAARKRERTAEGRSHELLELVGIAHLSDRRPSELPYGQQKRVELARALTMRPRLLLLDEPAGGLGHDEVAAFGALLKDVQRQLDLSVLLVEHNMAMVMGISDHIIVMDGGRVIAAGVPLEIRNDPRVVEAYLGVTA
ncbi:MAG: livG [Pseudonocardiales bacterium]|nr:livG [Pseudonocardiales bacterium]